MKILRLIRPYFFHKHSNEFSDAFHIKSGVKCVDSNGKDPSASASTLASAKEICMSQGCLMFYDDCGKGTRFKICPPNSKQIISTCGKDDPISGRNKRRDILYIKGKYL